MASPADAIGAEDRALLERLAAASWTCVSSARNPDARGGKPLSLLAGQTLTFFEPILQSLFQFADYRRFAALVERREALDEFIRIIEARADAAHESRRKTPTPGPRPRRG
jgi:hypothetical protein